MLISLISLFDALVALVEFFDSARRINQPLLSGKKRVRNIRDFDFDKRISVAVFPFDSFVRFDG